MCATAIDDVALNKQKYVEELLKYIHTDATCLRDSDPVDLVKVQRKNWDPLTKFIKKKLGVEPNVTEDLINQDQNQKLVDMTEDILHAMDPFTMTAVQNLTSTSKSLILSFAVLE